MQTTIDTLYIHVFMCTMCVGKNHLHYVLEENVVFPAVFELVPPMLCRFFQFLPPLHKSHFPCSNVFRFKVSVSTKAIGFLAHLGYLEYSHTINTKVFIDKDMVMKPSLGV